MIKPGDHNPAAAAADDLQPHPHRPPTGGGTTGVSLAALVVVILIAGIWLATRTQPLHGAQHPVTAAAPTSTGASAPR